MSIKQYGIALPDLTHIAGANWTASCVITGRLVAALYGTADFRSGYHALLMGESRDEIFRWNAEAIETSLEEAWAAISTEKARRKGQIMRAGAWL